MIYISKYKKKTRNEHKNTYSFLILYQFKFYLVSEVSTDYYNKYY